MIQKIILSVALTLTFLTASSQEDSFEKFHDFEGIESISLGKAFFEMLSSRYINSGTQQDKKLAEALKSIDSFKVFGTTDKKLSNSLTLNKESYVAKNALTTLFSVNDQGTQVVLYTDDFPESGTIKKVLLWIRHNDEVLLIKSEGNIAMN